jgi:chemotaxis protein methyltransferase CheR
LATLRRVRVGGAETLMTTPAITDQEFTQFQRFIYQAAGITLAASKKALVSGRLATRLQERNCQSYAEYLRLLVSGKVPEETQTAVDLLTTNETYFFREMKHFTLLRELASQTLRERQADFRVWCAASSSGEEVYSVAMVLADCLGDARWQVLGSDISTRVLARARAGHYSMQRAMHVPPAFLKRFCLRGVGEYEGTLLVDKALRNRVEFRQINLNATLPVLGTFDVIFLRNVMIYFNNDTKHQVVARLASLLKPGGHFLIGHSENLNGINESLRAIAPSIYRKPGSEARPR